jgi:hypothetical protein
LGRYGDFRKPEFGKITSQLRLRPAKGAQQGYRRVGRQKDQKIRPLREDTLTQCIKTFTGLEGLSRSTASKGRQENGGMWRQTGPTQGHRFLTLGFPPF